MGKTHKEFYKIFSPGLDSPINDVEPKEVHRPQRADRKSQDFPLVRASCFDVGLCSDRLRALREEKNLSQGDIEKRTGSVAPLRFARRARTHGLSVETLEKMARAAELPMYRMFYNGDAHAKT